MKPTARTKSAAGIASRPVARPTSVQKPAAKITSASYADRDLDCQYVLKNNKAVQQLQAAGKNLAWRKKVLFPLVF